MNVHQVLVYNSSLDQWRRLWVKLPDPGPAPGSTGVQVNKGAFCSSRYFLKSPTESNWDNKSNCNILNFNSITIFRNFLSQAISPHPGLVLVKRSFMVLLFHLPAATWSKTHDAMQVFILTSVHFLSFRFVLTLILRRDGNQLLLFWVER